jgi:signal transduction histidine kinase
VASPAVVSIRGWCRLLPWQGTLVGVRIDLARYQALWYQLRGVVGLAAITWAMVATAPHPGSAGARAVTLVGVVVAACGWLAALLSDDCPLLVVSGLVLCAGAGVVLTVSSPHNPAIGYLAAVCLYGGVRLRPVGSITVTGGALGGYALGQFALGAAPIRVAAFGAGLVVALLAGVIRRQVDQRAEQTQLLLAESQHAREEQARSAALAERARIAREIHDVLAHSLAALSVQLETADALLESGHPDRARTTLGRARQLTREGLAETRRAISALHGDAVPLPLALTSLAQAYTADTGCPAYSTVEGQPRRLSVDTGLAVYRTAQEALTNARKHASGAAVTLRLAYRPEEVALTVTDGGGGPTRQPARDGATTPACGYGLIGLRERAELAGGMFHAGPCGHGWRVDVRIPG